MSYLIPVNFCKLLKVSKSYFLQDPQQLFELNLRCYYSNLVKFNGIQSIRVFSLKYTGVKNNNPLPKKKSPRDVIFFGSPLLSGGPSMAGETTLEAKPQTHKQAPSLTLPLNFFLHPKISLFTNSLFLGTQVSLFFVEKVWKQIKMRS